MSHQKGEPPPCPNCKAITVRSLHSWFCLNCGARMTDKERLDTLRNVARVKWRPKLEQELAILERCGYHLAERPVPYAPPDLTLHLHIAPNGALEGAEWVPTSSDVLQFGTTPPARRRLPPPGRPPSPAS